MLEEQNITMYIDPIVFKWYLNEYKFSEMIVYALAIKIDDKRVDVTTNEKP